MKSNLKFNFTAGLINGIGMNLTVNQSPITVSEKFVVDIDVELPTTVEFQLSGKNPSDTVVKNGEILADKYVKLETIVVDGFTIFPYQVSERYLTLTTNNTTISADYWGVNGIAKFTIDQDDPALWLIECPGIIH